MLVSEVEASRWVESTAHNWVAFFLEWQILCADGILGAQDCAGWGAGESCAATVVRLAGSASRASSCGPRATAEAASGSLVLPLPCDGCNHS